MGIVVHLLFTLDLFLGIFFTDWDPTGFITILHTTIWEMLFLGELFPFAFSRVANPSKWRVAIVDPDNYRIPSLKLTAIAPKNGWLEYDPFLLGQTAYFQGRTVKLREGTPEPTTTPR